MIHFNAEIPTKGTAMRRVLVAGWGIFDRGGLRGPKFVIRVNAGHPMREGEGARMAMNSEKCPLLFPNCMIQKICALCPPSLCYPLCKSNLFRRDLKCRNSSEKKTTMDCNFLKRNRDDKYRINERLIDELFFFSTTQHLYVNI